MTPAVIVAIRTMTPSMMQSFDFGDCDNCQEPFEEADRVVLTGEKYPPGAYFTVTHQICPWTRSRNYGLTPPR